LGNYYGWCVYDYRGGAEMNIIELAKQVGMVYREFEDEFANSNTDGVDLTTLQKFAASVAAHEREACAKICDDGYFAFIAADIIRERETT